MIRTCFWNNLQKVSSKSNDINGPKQDSQNRVKSHDINGPKQDSQNRVKSHDINE